MKILIAVFTMTFLAGAAQSAELAGEFINDSIRDYCSFRKTQINSTHPKVIQKMVREEYRPRIRNEFKDPAVDREQYVVWLTNCMRNAKIPVINTDIKVKGSFSIQNSAFRYRPENKQLGLSVYTEKIFVRIPAEIIQGWEHQIAEASLNAIPIYRTSRAASPDGSTAVPMLAVGYSSGLTSVELSPEEAERFVNTFPGVKTYNGIIIYRFDKALNLELHRLELIDRPVDEKPFILKF